LKAKNQHLNVQLEDWLDASEIQTEPSNESKHC
jgi:hypothetical protein